MCCGVCGRLSVLCLNQPVTQSCMGNCHTRINDKRGYKNERSCDLTEISSGRSLASVSCGSGRFSSRGLGETSLSAQKWPSSSPSSCHASTCVETEKKRHFGQFLAVLGSEIQSVTRFLPQPSVLKQRLRFPPVSRPRVGFL